MVNRLHKKICSYCTHLNCCHLRIFLQVSATTVFLVRLQKSAHIRECVRQEVLRKFLQGDQHEQSLRSPHSSSSRQAGSHDPGFQQRQPPGRRLPGRHAVRRPDLLVRTTGSCGGKPPQAHPLPIAMHDCCELCCRRRRVGSSKTDGTPVVQ